MHPLAAKVAALHRRLVWRERALAACSVLAVVLAAACLLGLADYVLRFSDRGTRVLVTAALAVIAAWAVYRWWFSRRARRDGPLGVARRVESQFPQLRDRLASALEFLGQDENDPTAGSAALRRAVVADADHALGELPIDLIIDRRPLRRAATWAAIAAAIVAVCLAIDAASVRTAFVRLLAPLGATEWPRVNHLEFRDPPTRLAAGQTFEAELIDRDGTLPDDVRIEYRFSRDGRSEIQSEWMNRVGDVMVARREDVRQPFAFRAEGGDDHAMPWINVKVAEPPQLASLAIVTRPPAYTGLPAAAAEPQLDVLAGTGIEISGTSNEPLAAARVIVGDETIEAEVRADATGQESRAFILPAERFVAARSSPYKIELENREGVAGTSGQWNLRVEPDTPPSVSWQKPQADLFVLPTAVVPIAVAVKDNLAIARVALAYTRSGQPEDKVETIELYRGPEHASPAEPSPGPSLQGRGNSGGGDSRVIEYSWSLEPLELAVGTQLTLKAQAEDYRPGTGETTTPRRVTIISRDEFDARLADRQAQIARRLDEILTTERNVREDVRGVDIQVRGAGRVEATDRNSLQAAELNQRRVGRRLTDSAEGVPALADALLAELEMNGITDSDALQQMNDLQQALGNLASGPLAQADEQLTAARKTAETLASDRAKLPADQAAAREQAAVASLSQSLPSAAAGEDQVIAAVERLLAGMTSSADFGRFVRELGQIREDQLAHMKSSRGAVDLSTLPLERRELSRPQQATIDKAAAGEEALTRRYERTEQGMSALATALRDKDPSVAARLGDAVDLARQLSIAGTMHQTSADWSENRVGQSLRREQQIADALDQVLDLLREGGGASSPAKQLDQMKAAERDLAALQKDLAELRKQIAEAEQQPKAAANDRKLAELRQQQDQLRARADRLARQLERLQASEAAHSTSQASSKLGESQGDKKPASSASAQQAEQHLAEAARQLAERRRAMEEDLARMMLRQFEVAITAMVERQKIVLADTIEAASAADPKAIAELAAKEHQLADDAHVQSELVHGLSVFVVALEDANKQLTAAAGLLDAGNPGPPTQRAERLALDRFEQIVAALKQAAAEANKNQQPGGQGNPGGGGGPSKRPTFDLFEVKLLRSLQADLNQRTQDFEKQLSESPTPNGDERAAQELEAAELAKEQGRLAELVKEIANRNNQQQKDE